MTSKGSWLFWVLGASALAGGRHGSAAAPAVPSEPPPPHHSMPAPAPRHHASNPVTTASKTAAPSHVHRREGLPPAPVRWGAITPSDPGSRLDRSASDDEAQGDEAEGEVELETSPDYSPSTPTQAWSEDDDPGIYRWVDSDGTVVYSDHEFVPAAQERTAVKTRGDGITVISSAPSDRKDRGSGR